MMLDDNSTKHLRSTIVWIAPAVQERRQLQGELDQAVRRLSARVRTLHNTTPPAKTIVLNREVLTSRSEFRLRGVLVPPTMMLSDRWAILVELERTGKRKVRLHDLCDRLGLTAREAEIACLMGKGLSDQDPLPRDSASAFAPPNITRSVCVIRSALSHDH